ncbi:trypsin-like peptidase domain-containing protein [Candidatus Woesearchaeota archaeon]|nr:trypsin-like peptidase domain-containing protein [Candidatus Woesearchaeota archaeon]
MKRSVFIALAIFSLIFAGCTKYLEEYREKYEQKQNEYRMQQEEKLNSIKRSLVWVKYEVQAKTASGVQFKSTSSGSGIIFASNRSTTQIFTNKHVLDCSFDQSCGQKINEKVRVRLDDGTFHEATKISLHPDLDVAVIEISPGKDYRSYAAQISEGALRAGDEIIVAGYPSFAQEVVELSIVKGTMIGVRNLMTNSGYQFQAFDSDAYAYFGSSGGGFFNSEGKLEGIVTWASTDGTRAYALNISELKKGKKFLSCPPERYVKDGKCLPFCTENQALGEDEECHDRCTGFYCESEQQETRNTGRCPEGYIYDNFLCHPACGSPNTYCDSYATCFRDECKICPVDTQLYTDGKCRAI